MNRINQNWPDTYSLQAKFMKHVNQSLFAIADLIQARQIAHDEITVDFYGSRVGVAEKLAKKPSLHLYSFDGHVERGKLSRPSITQQLYFLWKVRTRGREECLRANFLNTSYLADLSCALAADPNMK